MSDPLRICMVADDVLPAITGVGAHVQHVSRALVQRGHQVSVLTTRRPGEPEVEVWEGVRLHRLFSVSVYGFAQALPSGRTIRRILERESPQLLHHHYLGWMMARSCAAAVDLKLPQVSTYHFSAEVLTQPWPMRPLRPLVRRLVRTYNNRCQLLIAPSKALAAQLPGLGFSVPVRYISNPLVFANDDAVVASKRPTGFLVMFAGRLAPEKNLPLLLRAFAVLVAAVPEARLWLAGQGPERVELERACESLGIATKVDFLGFLAPAVLAQHYAACDVFVLPSIIEAQPLVVMEAMWFSKPVIVTRAILAAQEMVSQGENGFVVAPDDPAELAQRLKQLAADPQLCRTMGASGKFRAEAYRPEKIVGEIIVAYRDVLSDGC